MKQHRYRKISDRISDAAQKSFFGRAKEIAVIRQAIEMEDPPFFVAFVHGPGGIGKSRLVKAVFEHIEPKIRHNILDCRDIEPTPLGFLSALGTDIGMKDSEHDLNSIIDWFANTEQRTVLALDTYETFGLMDTWLRQEFIPALSENVFTIIAGRQAPNPAWLTTAGWSSIFKEIELGELSSDDATQMLELRSLSASQIDRVKHFARGYPLALEIAAAAMISQPDLEIVDGPPPKMLQQLTQAFLKGLPRKILDSVEAASTVRRVTAPLLRALLKINNVRDLYDNLGELPFTDVTAEGLIYHDVVRNTIYKDLFHRDPELYRLYRKRAYLYFTSESQVAVARNLWQFTADLLYMVENPFVRDAFFPEGGSDLRVEPATALEENGIIKTMETAEPAESARLLKFWWNHHPKSFRIVKDREGKQAAFYILFEPETVDRRLLEEDPLTSVWLRHLDDEPIAEDERVLFCRRWVDRITGELPSPAVSACFLDVKRAYMELRPSLRRIYFPVIDLPTFESILFPLGFTTLKNCEIKLGDVTYHSLMNDFGPSSVDGWLATIFGAELGVEEDHSEAIENILDTDVGYSRQLLTVLFTDIVGSTELAVKLGDIRWRDLLDNHHAMVRKELLKYQGREIDIAGDGFFATFEMPVNGIQCACAISEAVRKLNITIRAGLHLGECEVIRNAVRGITVHIGARVVAKAEAGKVLVSSTIKDAVAGANLRFKNVGSYTLKGIPGNWNLFSVEEVGTV